MMELKPCPFCGEEAILDNVGVRYGEYKYECKNNFCQASYMLGAIFDTEFEARQAWNRRTNDGTERKVD